MSFREFNNDMNFAKMSLAVQQMWQQQDIFARTLGEYTAQGQPRAEFVFYEGPPSANGRPGIHHMLARTLKDVFCRYKTLKGFRVPRVAGWDTHGLPVELGVEQELGISKQDIGEHISVEDFNHKCHEAVGRYLEQWEAMTTAMGYWVDLQAAYQTCSPQYMESVWWLVAEIHRRGYLYQGYSIQPFSPGAGTALSSHELNQPGCYRMVKDLSCVVQFPLVESAQLVEVMGLGEWAEVNKVGQVSLLAWTTTPWTLPAHCALCVNPAITYVLVGTWHKYTGAKVLVVLAKETLSAYFGEGGSWADFVITGEFFDQDLVRSRPYDHRYFKILGECDGRQLVGLSYQPPFDLGIPQSYQSPGKFYEVLADDFVSTTEGTGVVHLAPCYGADDYRVCAQYQFGTKDIVNSEGRYHDELNTYGGRYIKEEYKQLNAKLQLAATGEESPHSLDVDLVMELKQRGLAFRIFKIEHSYPHCWRSDMPIFYRPVESWFIRTTAIKDQLIALNKEIQWYPQQTGRARFADWLANLVDWNVSRSRYWGTPLPIWTNRAAIDGDHHEQQSSDYEYKVIGSVAELYREIEHSLACGHMQSHPFTGLDQAALDLHRTTLDKIILVDSQGRPMYRENDVLDVWFDSGAMPYAAVHYPVSGSKLRLPADFIAEGMDQTRGWFFSLHVIAALCFDSVAYKHVLSSGLVLDKAGRKMSKRLGNTIDPMQVIEDCGADVVRWYMLSNAKPWENLKFDYAGLRECSNKFFHTLFQVYQFFGVYANVDGLTPSQFAADDYVHRLKQSPLGFGLFDRWLIAELHELIAEVEIALEQYDPTTATRAIQHFTLEKLSNWYVRLNRRRFWKHGEVANKSAGYHTLWYTLYTLSQLSSPFAPMLSDWLWRDLGSSADSNDQDRSPSYLDSVHLGGFPVHDPELVDRELMRNMADTRQIASLVLSLREKAGIRVRQPLACVYLVDFEPTGGSSSLMGRLGELIELIKRETNVKTIKRMDPADAKLSRSIKPNYPRLGARLGKYMKAVTTHLRELSARDISCLQREGGELSFTVDTQGDSELIQLTSEDVLITYEDHAELLMASTGGLTVALSTYIDDELRYEGMIRELVNRVQNIRKAQGFAITDRIAVVLSEDAKIVQALAHGEAYFVSETLCHQLTVVPSEQMPAAAVDISFDGMELKVVVVSS